MLTGSVVEYFIPHLCHSPHNHVISCVLLRRFFYVLKYILRKNPICNAIVACYKVDRKCKVMKFYLRPQVEFLPTFQ